MYVSFIETCVPYNLDFSIACIESTYDLSAYTYRQVVTSVINRKYLQLWYMCRYLIIVSVLMSSGLKLTSLPNSMSRSNRRLPHPHHEDKSRVGLRNSLSPRDRPNLNIFLR